MKVDLQRFQKIVSQFYYEVAGYGTLTKPIELNIEFVSEDPGNGVLTDAIRLTATTIQPADNSHNERTITRTLEIYPSNEKVAPKMQTLIVEDAKG